jgi:hypothetical protein
MIVIRIPVSLSMFSTGHHHLTRSVHRSCSAQIWVRSRDGLKVTTRPVRKVSSHIEYWPWCNLAAGQGRLYLASVNSHSPVGLVSQHWEAVDSSRVTCDRRFHNDRASRSASSWQCACPFYSFLAGFFWTKRHITHVCQPPYSPDLAPCDFWLFPVLKLRLKGRRCANATVTQYTNSVNGVSLPTD